MESSSDSGDPRDLQARIDKLEQWNREQNQFLAGLCNLLGIGVKKDPSTVGRLNFMLLMPKNGTGPMPILSGIIKEINNLKNPTILRPNIILK